MKALWLLTSAVMFLVGLPLATTLDVWWPALIAVPGVIYGYCSYWVNLPEDHA